MNTWEIILGILVFAAVTAVLYVWGLRKSMTQSADLERILINKSAQRVMHHLKQHGEITLPQIVQLCSGVKAGQFWSRQKAAVQNPKAFAPKLVQYMVDQRLLEELPGRRFRLKK